MNINNLFFLSIILSLNTYAQPPQKFNYQAVVRNNTGVVVANQNIAVKAEILDSNSTTILYSETHNITTNAQGLFALQVGGGSVKSGVFANIDWSVGNKYIRTSVDLTGGTNFQLVGTSQLLSVPYSLQTKNIAISRVGDSDSIYFGDKLLIIPGVKVVNTTPDITTGLVAYYPFNGNANDESGNGNNGTVIGANLTTDRLGNSNEAYRFNGGCNSSFIHAIINTSSIQNGLTISIWALKSGDGCIGPRILEFGNNPEQTDGIGVAQWGWDNNDNTSFGSKISTGKGVYSNFKPSNNNWIHLVYTHDGMLGRFYQNGVLIDSITSIGNPILLGNVSFGQMNHPAYDAFNGKLDDIRIYNRALSQEEITYLATH